MRLNKNLSPEKSSLTVSVILPTFNRSKYLKKSIDSVLAQNTQYSFEIIIVDDNSNDDTEETLKDYGSSIKYIKLERRMGGGAARNRGITESMGELIAFIDSDVIWLNHKLETQVNALYENPDYSCVYSRFTKITKSGQHQIRPKLIFSGHQKSKILMDNFIDTPTAVIKKDTLVEIGGFDESLPRFQDWELFIRLCQHTKIVGIEESLIESLDLDDSISRNHLARAAALNIIFRKHYLLFKQKQKTYYRICLKVVNSYLIIGNKKSAREFIYKEITPTSPMYYPLIIISMLPSKLFKHISEK